MGMVFRMNGPIEGPCGPCVNTFEVPTQGKAQEGWWTGSWFPGANQTPFRYCRPVGTTTIAAGNLVVFPPIHMDRTMVFTPAAAIALVFQDADTHKTFLKDRFDGVVARPRYRPARSDRTTALSREDKRPG